MTRQIRPSLPDLSGSGAWEIAIQGPALASAAIECEPTYPPSGDQHEQGSGHLALLALANVRRFRRRLSVGDHEALG
jgi:hypothetical protein